MLKQIYQQIQLTCDSLITVTIKSLFGYGDVYNSSIQTKETMTTWAIQPSHWGNQVLIGAEMTHDFQTAEDIALDMATDNMEQVCIFKVGTKADIKWKAIN
tara:strand:- start:1 stop:303 length:303 start_codon:yes stop_codon:yes gene_type:complete